MNQQETNKILALMVEVYPKFNESRNPQVTSRLWSALFADEPYEWVEKAFMAYVATDTRGFPPSPGAIKEKIMQLSGQEEPTELEAWDKVYKAICRSGYNSREEFEKLPKGIREIVGSPRQLFEWSQMDSDEVNTVVASNFQRSYRGRAGERQVLDRIPDSLKISLPSVESVALPDSSVPVLEEHGEEFTEMPQSLRDILNGMRNAV